MSLHHRDHTAMCGYNAALSVWIFTWYAEGSDHYNVADYQKKHTIAIIAVGEKSGNARALSVQQVSK